MSIAVAATLDTSKDKSLSFSTLIVISFLLGSAAEKAVMPLICRSRLDALEISTLPNERWKWNIP